MRRQARLDAPGTLPHVMGRGIEGAEIFRSKNDRMDFLGRFATLCEKECLIAYSWALMPNHFHLLVRAGNQPLSASMKGLLTGHVINFDRRHRRRGYVFQNRYKSIGCEDDPYLVDEVYPPESGARRVFCQLAIKKMGHPGAEVARFLGGDDLGVVSGGRCRGILGPEEIPLSLFRNTVPTTTKKGGERIRGL
jgi:hypothetical protein